MTEFSVVVELGDYALMRVRYDSKDRFIYTGKRTGKGRWMKAVIKEDIFKRLVETYLKAGGINTSTAMGRAIQSIIEAHLTSAAKIDTTTAMGRAIQGIIDTYEGHQFRLDGARPGRKDE